MRRKRCVATDELICQSLAKPTTRNEELAQLAKAFSHPVRLQIIRVLQEKQSCICGELVDELPLAQSTVSQHLKVLKSAGIIQGEVSGPKVCYALVPAAIERLKQLLSDY